MWCFNAVPILLVRFRRNKLRVGRRSWFGLKCLFQLSGTQLKIFWGSLKPLDCVGTNMPGNCPKVSLKISSGVKLTDAEVQSCTAVTGLTAFLTCYATTIPLHLLTWESGHKHVMGCDTFCKNVNMVRNHMSVIRNYFILATGQRCLNLLWIVLYL